MDFVYEGLAIPKFALLLACFSYDIVGLAFGWQKYAHAAHMTGTFALFIQSHIFIHIGRSYSGILIE